MKFTSFLEFSCTLNIWTIEIRCLRVQAIMLPQLLSRGKKKRKKKVRKGVTRPIIRLEVHTTSNFPLETKKMLISLMGKDKTKWTSVFFFFFFFCFFRWGDRGLLRSTEDQFKISESEIRIHIHCPSKLRQKRLVEYLWKFRKNKKQLTDKKQLQLCTKWMQLLQNYTLCVVAVVVGRWFNLSMLQNLNDFVLVMFFWQIYC